MSAPKQAKGTTKADGEDKASWTKVEAAERGKFSMHRRWLQSAWLPKTRSLLRDLWIEMQAKIRESGKHPYNKNVRMRFRRHFEAAWELVSRQIGEHWNGIADYNHKRLGHFDVAMSIYRYIEAGQDVEVAREQLASESETWKSARKGAAEAWDIIEEMLGEVDDAVDALRMILEKGKASLKAR